MDTTLLSCAMEVAARVPQRVIVLISALNFHQIGTHQAHAVWIQLRRNAVTPRIDYPPLSIVRTGLPEAFTAGVEQHELNGIPVRITTPARTVADCFKHRKKLGLELCLEALREVARNHAKPAEILRFAEMNRVSRIVIPYLSGGDCMKNRAASIKDRLQNHARVNRLPLNPLLEQFALGRFIARLL